MKKVCAVSGKEFEVTVADLKFYEKMGVPAPTLCPEERRRRRLAWRNTHSLFQRKCDATGKSIISIHTDQVPFPVYSLKYWWSDNWDALDFGQEFDFNRSFFEQFNNFEQKVPQIAIMNDNGVASENCEYCQDFSNGKNCYLVSGTWQNRDSLYCDTCNHGIESVDCIGVNQQFEQVYESINCQQLYCCAFMQNSENCSECYFGLNLRGCKHCFGCVNLQQKEYYILNKPYSKEEYFQKIKAFDTGSYKKTEELKAYFQDFIKQFPRKFSNLKHCEDCSGDHLYNCKNVYDSFDVVNGFQCHFFDRGDAPESCYDIIQSGKPKWCYESITPDNSWMCAFTLWCWKSKNLLYCDNCHSCTECFGCISLRHKQYCIFNKQYSEKEYFALKEKIIKHMKKYGEWGEFFPIKYSPFAYNDTVAGFVQPLSKEEIQKHGWKWREDKSSNFQTSNYHIPDHISDVTDDILKETLICKATGKNYKIQPLELSFYRKMNLPIPQICPIERHRLRFNRCEDWNTYSRNCDKCNVKIKSTFPPEYSGKVYCERCYLDVVE